MHNGTETMWEALKLHPNLLKGIHDLGFLRPTPIQAQTIPLILGGRDVIGCAQTGTGKTAAFVLPILHKLLEGKSTKNVRALIIAPTRELALQSMDHLKSLSRYVHLKGEAIFGGVPMQPQISALARGMDILSATPGRLLDHVYSGRIDFVDLQTLVLDEADRMLDMGFLPDIRKILSLLPPKRQNLLFSATMPQEILNLTRELLHNPASVQIGPRLSPAVGIRQAVYPVSRHLKTDLLVEILRGQGMNSVLIFVRTKRSTDRLMHELVRRGIRASVLHGDRSQSQRLRALEDFRYGKTPVMVATDIAARGIDIEDITHVINYDVPEQPEDYIHRIGRTARAEATGDAFTLVDKEEESRIVAIERVIHRTLPRITLPNFHYKKPGGLSSSPIRSQGRRDPGSHSGTRYPTHQRRHGVGGERHAQSKRRRPY